VAGKRSLKLLAILCAAAALAACSQREEGVYGEPIPDPADKAAIERIAQQLSGDDREAWRDIAFRMAAADQLGIDSDSVREAIEREKVRGACVRENSGENVYDEAKRAILYECMREPI
jgi:hypothetical protein